MPYGSPAWLGWSSIVAQYDGYSTREFLEERGWSESAIELSGLAWHQEALMSACNALSISRSTGIPRETVRRRVEALVKRGWVRRDVRGHLRARGALLAGITAGIALAVDIEGGFFDRLLSAPIQRVSIVLGRVTGTAVLGALQATLFLLVAVAFGARYEGGITGVLVAILLASLTSAATAGIGAAIALRTGSLSLLQNLFPFVFVLLFTAPAFFPRDLLNPALRDVSRFNPLTYIVEGIRAALHDDRGLGDPCLGLVAALGFAVIATALAVWAMRERLRTQ
mgnify:CR=1 FL=1